MSFLAEQLNPSAAKPRLELAKGPAAPDATPRYQWAVIEPDIFLGEDVLFVIDPACLNEARAAHPGLVTYLTSEIDLLWPFRDNKEFIKGIHRVKKHLGGWEPQVQLSEGLKETIAYFRTIAAEGAA